MIQRIDLSFLTGSSVKELRKGGFSINKSPVDYSIVLFFILIIVSLYFSVDFYKSRLSFYKSISYFLLFYYVIYNIKNKQQIIYLSWAIVIFGSLYATVALSFMGADFLGFKNFSNEEHITLTFVNRNHFAGFLEMIVWIAVGLALNHQGSKRVLFLFLATYMASAIFLSLSRGGSIGFLSSAVFLIIIFFIIERKKKNPLLIGGFLLLIASSLFWLGIGPIISRFETLQDPELAGVSRFQYWATSLKIIYDHFWIGTGLGTYSTVYPQYQADHSSMFVTHAHNDYLELTTEMGMSGIISFAGIILAFYYTVIKRIKSQTDPFLKIIALVVLASVFSLIVHSFTDFNFHIPSNVLLFAVLAAIAIRASTIGTINEEKNMISFRINPSKTRWYKTILIVLFSFITISYIQPYSGDVLYKKAGVLQSEKKYTEAEKMLQTAIIIDRKNPEYFIRLADLLNIRASQERTISDKTALWEEAQKNYKIAIEKCSVNSMYYTRLAFVLQKLKRNDEALEAFKNAIIYMPNKSYTHYNLGLFFFNQKRYEEAEEEFTQALVFGTEYLSSIISYMEGVGRDYEYIRRKIPAKVVLQISYANILTKQKNYKNASMQWLYIYELDPTERNAESYINAVIREKDFERAIEICNQFLGQYKDSIRLKERLVYLLQKTKNNEKLIATLLIFIEEHPQHIPFFLRLASTYYGIGEKIKAEDIYTEQISLHPDNAELYFALANYNKKEKSSEQTLENLKKAVKIAPLNIQYRYQLALEYQNLNLYAAAIEQLEKCLDIRPTDKRSKQSLDRIYKILGIRSQD